MVDKTFPTLGKDETDLLSIMIEKKKKKKLFPERYKMLMCLKAKKLESQEVLHSVLLHISLRVCTSHQKHRAQNELKGQAHLLLGEGLLSRHMKL